MGAVLLAQQFRLVMYFRLASVGQRAVGRLLMQVLHAGGRTGRLEALRGDGKL